MSSPYLPFLDGPAKVAPQLKPILMKDWLPRAPDQISWLAEKRALIADRADEVIAECNWAKAAAAEAVSVVWSHLGGSEDSPPATLASVSEHVSDDLCVMVPREGAFCLGSASLCAPTYWSLRENIGKPLGGLHEAVPGGDPGLSSRINRVFLGLQRDLILERFNWTVQLGPEKFTPSSAPMKTRLATLSHEQAASELHLRVERQTIQKLPETGAALFTIRILVDPLESVFADPTYRKSFQESWEGTAPELAEYKGWHHYEPILREHVFK